MTPEQGTYTITYGSRREKGLVRQENQDQLISFDSSVFGQVFLLADGMGGHEGGQVAANMAITGFKQHFQTLATRLPLEESLMEAARLTNLDIYEKSNETGAGALRMGSTLVVCVMSAGSYVVAHAGDSRCYSFYEGDLVRLTKDHTAVQKMVDAGILSTEDAKNHPDASVLTRAFGQRPTIELEVSEPQSLAVDETLLICSDGLYGYVEEPAIVRALEENSDPQAAADALLELALDAGGHDNISLFVIRAEPTSTKGITAPDPPFEAEPVVEPRPTPKTALDIEPLPPASAKATPKPDKTKPAPQADKKRRYLAFWLMGIALLIAAGPVAAILRPELVPSPVRKQLTAWGIPVPQVGGVQTASVTQPVDSSRIPRPQPAGSDPDAQVAESSAKSLADAGSAGSPIRPKVVVIFPPDSGTAFADQVHGYISKIRRAGFEVSEERQKVDSAGVWRSVTADPAAFAPDHTFVTAVFPAGLDHEAERICRVVSCTQPGGLIRSGGLRAFQESFGTSAVGVFVHPAVSGTLAQKHGGSGSGAQGARPVRPPE